MTGNYLIGEAARCVGLSVDALRYYESIGVVPPARRDMAGRRLYRSEDLHLLEILLHLRDTGMPLTEIAQFTRFVQQDPHGVPERLALLRRHRDAIVENIERLTRSLEVIDTKITDYSTRPTIGE